MKVKENEGGKSGKACHEKSRLKRKPRNVFLRSDFAALGEYDQVGRAIRRLVRQGKLIRIGQGLYAKAAQSPFDGSPVPVKGIRALAAEALNRIGVKCGPSRLEKAYNAWDRQRSSLPEGFSPSINGFGARSARTGLDAGFEREDSPSPLH